MDYRRLLLPALLLLATPLYAQDADFQLSDRVDVPLVDRRTTARLEQADAFVAEGRFDEAVSILQTLIESPAEGLIAVHETRYVGLRRWVRIHMLGYPPELIAAYRKRTDASARRAYDEAVAERDADALRHVVAAYPLGSYADDALDRLAEIALEDGRYDDARACWEMLVPPPPIAESETPNDADAPRWFVYPNTDLDLASLRARLVLVSILQGDAARARRELDAFEHLHADAEGALGGETVVWRDALADMLRQSERWPKPIADHAWPTFAGAGERERRLPSPLDLRGAMRQADLPAPPIAHVTSIKAATDGWPHRRPSGETSDRPLSYHPVLREGRVFVCTPTEILGFDADTALPLWGGESPVLFRDPDAEIDSGEDDDPWAMWRPAKSLNTPRFTLTVHDRVLAARMGEATTILPDGAELGRPRGGYLVALDLDAQGRLLWKIDPPDERTAFEGAPLLDDQRAYVALRRFDIASHAIVAAYDATTGEPRWRTEVCAAEPLARGRFHETTHALLTRHGDTLYYNTNQGAIASLDARSGELVWVSVYPRDGAGSYLRLPEHWGRELTPCVYDRGALFVAPMDAARVMAFDARDGRLLWRTSSATSDVVHVLGVDGPYLLASGRRLHWIRAADGRIERIWPDGAADLGRGRGLLAGGFVYWPTRERLLALDIASGRPVREYDWTARGVDGGNVIADQLRVVVASHDRLTIVGRNEDNTTSPSQDARRENE